MTQKSLYSCGRVNSLRGTLDFLVCIERVVRTNSAPSKFVCNPLTTISEIETSPRVNAITQENYHKS